MLRLFCQFILMIAFIFLFSAPSYAQGSCREIAASDFCAAGESTCFINGENAQWFCCGNQAACDDLRTNLNQPQVVNQQNSPQLIQGSRPAPCTPNFGGGEGIPTGLGCIPTKPKGFIEWLFGLTASMGGGVAFIIMGIGAFDLITSQGNPDQIKKGRELITSAFAGLLFIIFSVYLLKLIGVNILQIPGLRS